MLRTDTKENVLKNWEKAHESFRHEFGDAELLDPRIASRLGFVVAKKEMRQIMLQDTAVGAAKGVRGKRERKKSGLKI